jgi:hypothetical protein
MNKKKRLSRMNDHFVGVDDSTAVNYTLDLVVVILTVIVQATIA